MGKIKFTDSSPPQFAEFEFISMSSRVCFSKNTEEAYKCSLLRVPLGKNKKWNEKSTFCFCFLFCLFEGLSWQFSFFVFCRETDEKENDEKF